MNNQKSRKLHLGKVLKSGTMKKYEMEGST